MDFPLEESRVYKNVDWLTSHLTKALNSATRRFDEIKQLNKKGLYLVFNDIEILYVGKTTRTGKIRLNELITDYRSHTFNRKLLLEHLISKGIPIRIMNNKTKFELIQSGALTLEQFKVFQREVNKQIKDELKFKFYEFDLIDLVHLEHFAISVLKPLHND